MTSGRIAYSVDRASHRVTVLVSSQPNDDDFIAFFNRILADPNFHTGDDFLWDRQAVKEVASREYAQNMARLIRESKRRIGSGRVAVVVSADSLAHFGMARMAQMLSDWGEQFRVFTELNDAVAWLDEGLVADRPESPN